MKLFVTKRLSKKGNNFFCLCADLGYRVVVISYDLALCVELTGKSFDEIKNIQVDEQVLVGQIVKV